MPTRLLLLSAAILAAPATANAALAWVPEQRTPSPTTDGPVAVNDRGEAIVLGTPALVRNRAGRWSAQSWPAANATPLAVAINAGGQAFAVYRQGSSIVARRRIATRWARAERIGPAGPGVIRSVRAAMSPEGIARVVWVSCTAGAAPCTVVAASRRPNRTRWFTLPPLRTGPVDDVLLPGGANVAIDTSGLTVAVWISGSPKRVRVARLRPGTDAWTRAEVVGGASPIPSDPVVAVNHRGDVAVAWAGLSGLPAAGVPRATFPGSGRSVFIRRAAASRWTSLGDPGGAEIAPSSLAPAIALDATGTVHAAVTRHLPATPGAYPAPHEVLLAKRGRGGTGWSAPIAVGVANAETPRVEVAAVTGGRSLVSWWEPEIPDAVRGNVALVAGGAVLNMTPEPGPGVGVVRWGGTPAGRTLVADAGVGGVPGLLLRELRN